jgi:hypothetical protein
MGYPTVKTLLRITDGDADKAKEIRGILDELIECGSYASVQNLDRQSYNPQPRHMRKLVACNEALGLFGIEYCTNRDRYPSGDDPKAFEHINTGETYCETLCYRNGRFFVASWGDIAERWK